MVKIIILVIILPAIIAATTTDCAPQCNTCSANFSPYSCLSCFPDNHNIYLYSCQNPSSQNILFIVITVIITTIHLFMLAMGLGVYHNIFENIQLASLVTWRYGFQGGAIVIQGTNLAIVRHNSFPDTFGSQFIVVMCLLGVFWLLLIVVDKIPHSPTATLIKRKKIIFPTRIITLIYNILIYSSLIQVTTTQTQPQFKVFAFVLAILALIKVAFVLIGLAVTSNWKNFQVDDPYYYVLVQEMTNKKWYAKNSILISLLVRGGIIIAFVVLFKLPQVAGLTMIILQVFYTLYSITLFRYTKLRYYIFIVASNVLMVAIFLVIYVASLSSINSDEWNKCGLAYVIMMGGHSIMFFMANSLQISLKKDIIVKQLKSFYYRFIKCQKLQQKVAASKYDEDSNRQKVTQFHANLLYHKQKDCVTIQMSNSSKEEQK